MDARFSQKVGRAEQLRARIADAALDLFLHEGFARTGVRRIAAAAGVSVGTIFNYFENKQEILFALISDMQKGVAIPLQAAAARYRERASAGEDPELALLSLLQDYAGAVDTWRRHLLLAYQEAHSLRDPQLREILDGERRMRDLLADLIELGVERGKFTPGDLRLRAHAIQVLMQSWATRRWALEGVADLGEFTQTAERALLGMLHASPVPRKPAGGD